jgi:hypothetical protein
MVSCGAPASLTHIGTVAGSGHEFYTKYVGKKGLFQGPERIEIGQQRVPRNYETNASGFIIFGAPDNYIRIFKDNRFYKLISKIICKTEKDF